MATLLLNTMVSGQPNGSTITMKGSSDHISVPDHPAWDLPGDFTLSMKVKFASNKWHMLLTHHDGAGTQGFEFSYTGSAIQLSPDGYKVCIKTPWAASLNTWYQISVTRKGSLFSTYVNGQLLGTNVYAGAIGTDDYPLMIGNYYYPGYNFEGEMDDVSIWNVALSQSQLQSMSSGTLTGNEPALIAYYDMERTGAGAGLPVTNKSSGGAVFNGVTVGSPTTPYFIAPPAQAGALHFDGVDDYVSIPYNYSLLSFSYSSMTLEATIKASTSQSANPCIFSNRGNWSGLVLMLSSSGKLSAIMGGFNYTSSSADLRDNAWHHIAAIWEGNNLKLFVDGTQVGNFTLNIDGLNTAHDLWIGLDGGNLATSKFKGIIDEVRIWNRPLCEAQIIANKSCQLTGTEANLVVYYRFNQGVANGVNQGISTLTDATANHLDGTLQNFALNGSASNWVEGNVSGTCSASVSCPSSSKISVAPLTIDFGDVISGNSKTGTILVKNTSPFTYSLYGMGWPSYPVFTTGKYSKSVLIPGDTVHIPVIFSPASVGQATGAVNVMYSASPDPVMIHLTGNGTVVSTVPTFFMDKSIIDFGNLGLGFSLTDTAVITNTGNAPLILSSPVSSSADFSIVYYKNTLAPNDTTQVVLRYKPSAAGSSSGTIAINHNAAGSPATIALQGTAVSTGYTFQTSALPGGYSGNLYGASWFNGLVGFACGANGGLFKTTDGGKTWTALPFDPSVTIYSIRCVGSALWLFCANGYAYVSDNGGESFSGYNTGSRGLYDGYFINGYYGFAVGSNGAIYRFANGGWTPYYLNISNHFYGVYAYGNSAWAVGSGGAFYRYNGATNGWGAIDLGVTNDIYGVGFWDESVGYVVGSDGLIYRTMDGGATWDPCHSGVRTAIKSIRCMSAALAWAVCSDGTVLQTTDGGGTWVRLPLGNFAIERIDFNDGQGMGVCQGGVVFVFRTTHWNGYYHPYYVRYYTGSSYGYYSGWYATRSLGGVAGRYGNVYLTTNGGQSWRGLNANTTRGIRSIRFYGGRVFLAGEDYLARCNEEGTDWVWYPVPDGTTFYSIAFHPNGRGWAVGSGGVIYEYNGVDWTPHTSALKCGCTLRYVYVVDDVAYAVGTGGNIWKYDGTGWVNVSPIGVPNYDAYTFYGCAFATPLVGYAVGGDGNGDNIILKTDDGGKTWRRINCTCGPHDFLAVEIGCRKEVIVAGKHGVVYKTTDGGENWEDISLGRDVDINSITIRDGKALLAAEGGEVYGFDFGSEKVTAAIVANGPTAFCEGGQVTLTASGGTSYQWSTGETTASIVVSKPGVYKVVAANEGGCRDEKEQEVFVNPLPPITFGLQPSVCLNGGDVQLSASPAGGVFSGSGVKAGSFDPKLAGLGEHTITYSVTTDKGCSNAREAAITVNPAPDITFMLPAAICINASPLPLTATPGGGVFSGNGVSNSAFYPENAGAGEATLTYSVTNAFGCSNAQTAGITVNALPSLTFNLQKSICENQPAITLAASPSGGVFSGPGVKGDRFDPTAAGAGTKTITYMFTDGNGCANSISQAILVNAAPLANAGPDVTVYDGYVPMSCTRLEGSATGGLLPYTFSWSDGGTPVSGNLVCPKANTGYTLTVTDANGCSSIDVITVNVKNVRCGPVKNSHKVLVCHTEPGKQTITLCVDDDAVPAHLAHGDYLGDCKLTGDLVKATVTRTKKAPEEVGSPVLYPNPSNGRFVLRLPVARGDVRIRITDLWGQVIAERVYKGNAPSVVPFNLQKAAKGLYLVQVIAGDQRVQYKLVLQ